MQRSSQVLAKRPISFNQPFIFSARSKQSNQKPRQNLYSCGVKSSTSSKMLPHTDFDNQQVLVVTTNSIGSMPDGDFYRILDTPTTPQFPVPADTSRMCCASEEMLQEDYHLQDDFSGSSHCSSCCHQDENFFDTGSEDLPWTPDTPSSDSKDPLMTDAVNIDTPIFSTFSPRKTVDGDFFSSNHSLDPTPTMSRTRFLADQVGSRYHNSYYFQQHQKPQYQYMSDYQQYQIVEETFSSFNKYDSSASSLISSGPVSKRSSSCSSPPPLPPPSPFTELPFDITAFSYPLPVANSSNSPVSSVNNSSGGSNKRKPRLHLLQFIYCLLNSCKPSQCVCWVDKDNCVFRIINPNKLTNLWGRYKQNPNMSFDSLSRSLRLYYASGRLERVAGQRNQYRFVNREESIDFNRRNKRKNQLQPQSQSSQQFISTSSSSTTSSLSPSSSGAISKSFMAGHHSATTHMSLNANITSNHNISVRSNAIPAASKAAIMFGTKIFCSSTAGSGHTITRCII